MVEVSQAGRAVAPSPPRFFTLRQLSAVQSDTTPNRTMLFETALRNMLEQPFGPYLEETVLSDKCKFTPSKRLLLGDFQLAYNNEPTGYGISFHP